MKDTSGAQVLGRTSLKRLGIVMVPTVVAAGALTLLMANGAVAVSLAISGQTAQMTVGKLQGNGFAQYGNVVSTPNGASPATAVAVSSFANAQITGGLCQSVTTDLSKVSFGVLGDYTLTLKATSANATNLIIDLQSLNADEADFTNINIGQDASTITNSATGAAGAVGTFGQSADSATLTGVQQVSNATTAGSFDLQGMSLSIVGGNSGCIGPDTDPYAPPAP